MLLTGCASPAVQETVPPADAQISKAEYPEMAPYPDEQAYINTKTGEFDSEGFDAVYSAWRESRSNQYNQPQGYADNLVPFFQNSIPRFLNAFEGDNPVCSPLNVYMALALLAEVTGGETQQQVLELLGASGTDTLRPQAGHVWNAHYCADGASACVLANSVWLKDGLAYNPDTLDILAKNYYASAFRGDLGSAEMDALLQSWINEQTGGLLEEQSQNIRMDPRTVLALASTIYYRAKWTTEFQEKANTEEAFHSPAGDVTATFLHQTLGYGPYFWGEDFGAVYLPLEDGSRMWLVLPDEGCSPADLLSSGHALRLILGEGDASENQKRLMVNLSLPKFDVAADASLVSALTSLGITHAFDPQGADFSPILPAESCWLDQVSHAARVAIDEQGVTAAAYTVMVMCGAGRPPEDQMDFILDRPFLFVITSRDNLPLFTGIVNQPG